MNRDFKGQSNKQEILFLPEKMVKRLIVRQLIDV